MSAGDVRQVIQTSYADNRYGHDTICAQGKSIRGHVIGHYTRDPRRWRVLGLSIRQNNETADTRIGCNFKRGLDVGKR